MSDFKDHRFKASNIELMEDQREQGHSLGERRQDVLDSLLNIILNHKKEIQKVPGTATIDAAKAWCAKRPGSGFRADTQNIGGDAEREVVIYDKSGKPFIVNGYRLKPSDYGMRKLYQEAVDKDPEGMIGTSMREWTTGQTWATVPEPGNMWNQAIVKNNEVYDRMKSWGYRMPAKPKKEASPYAIFSKLIAPIVKSLFNKPALYQRLASVFGLKPNVGPENLIFLNKIVSPISVYRFLYLRLVEQKFYFSLKQSKETKHINTFTRFKQYIKDHKATFRNWFLTYLMTGENKEKFRDSWVDEVAVLNVLVKDTIQLDGSDVQDGIVFLISVANLNDNTPISLTFNGESGTFVFKQILVDQNIAFGFNETLKLKSQQSKDLKKILAKWKKNAEASVKKYFKDERFQQAFFDDPTAETAFLEAIKQGVPNAPTQMMANIQKPNVQSPPRKPPVVEEVPEDKGIISADDRELEKFEDDDDDEKPLPKGQMTLDQFM